MSSQYKFVTPERSDPQVPSVNSAARSHAIRTGLQQGSLTLGNQGAHLSRETIRNKTQLKGRFRLSGATTQPPGYSAKKAKTRSHEQPSSGSLELVEPGRRRSPSPALMSIQEVGAHQVDPFDSLPVTRNPEVESLLRYFLTGFNLNLTTVDPRSAWFPYAIQSSATMHATLALAAAFWSAKLPSLAAPIRREGLRQKGEAMHHVMNQLTRRNVVSDPIGYRLLLASVATLANVEAFYGDFRTANVHLGAAYALFQSCGGTKTVQDDYVLCKCLNWIDIQLAVGLERMPLFPAFHSLDEDSLPSSLVRSASEPPLNHLNSLGDSKTLGAGPDHLPQVFTTIRQAIISQASAPVSPHIIRVLGNTADRSILCQLYGEPLDDGPSAHSRKRISALLVAAQIFLYIVLRHMPSTSSLIRILYGRLRRALEDTESIRETWATHHPALLWVSFVGILGKGAVAENEETQWYMSLLQSTLKQMSYSLEESACEPWRLRRFLSNFLWEERSCTPVLRAIIFPNSEIMVQPHSEPTSWTTDSN